MVPGFGNQFSAENESGRPHACGAACIMSIIFYNGQRIAKST